MNQINEEYDKCSHGFNGFEDPPPKGRPNRHSVKLRLEVLEERITPTNLMVINLSGDPNIVGSLPFEIGKAQPGDTIVFQANLSGTIPLTSQIALGKNGVANLTIDGTGANITVSGQNQTRLFEVEPNTTVTLTQLTLSNGEAAPSMNSDGGAILVDGGGAATLNNDTFTNNTANVDDQGFAANGGAIENVGQLTINNCAFNDNSANANGGAIENFGTLIISANPNNDTTFSSNTAALNGGAVDSNSFGPGGNATITNVSFLNNLAKGGNGGAIYASDPFTLSDDLFVLNQALVNNTSGLGGSGGAIFSAASATLELQDSGSTFRNNFAQVNGGAIDTANQTAVAEDTFTSNGAGENGGAIFNEASNQLTVINSSLTYNTAANNGGAIENMGNLSVTGSSTPTVFMTNSAQINGGAIDSNALGANAQGQLSVSGTDFYGNQAIGGAGGAINTADNAILQSDDFDQILINKTTYRNGALVSGGALNATGGVHGSQTLNIVGSFFSESVVGGVNGLGGAIYTAAATSVSTSSFTNNEVTGVGSSGGAIAYGITNQNNPTTPYNSGLTIEQDFFDGNTATNGLGGAIYSSISANAGNFQTWIATSLFQDNIAGIGGGGVFAQMTTNLTGYATALFHDDTFYNNSASTGAGIDLANLTGTGASTPTASLTSLTIFENTASTIGGGVYVGNAANQTVSFDNNILDGNHVTAPNYTGPLDISVAVQNSVIDKGFNLIDPSDVVVLTGNDIVNGVPGLIAPPANNNALPGFQNTLALANNSPALGAGDPGLAGTTDGRGRTRQAGNVSIGAEDPNAI